MNSKKSKKLLAKAKSFKRVKRGDMIAETGYKFLKDEDRRKKKTQVVKPTVSKRQKYLAEVKKSISLTTLELRGRARSKAREQAPKKKAHKF